MSNAESVRKRWTDKALSTLPPERTVNERNTVITGTYAHWYLQHPDIFKWAGMATFASHRVGLAIAPYEFIADNGVVTRAKDQKGNILAEVFEDINLVRETNNNVYADIGWTHLAYVAPDGGLAEVEAGLADIARTHYRLIEGFKLIDRGKMQLDAGRAADGMKDIWEGNALLLEHEQFITVQPAFDRLDRAFDLFMSVFTTMNFSANNLTINWDTGTSFMLFMTTGGLSKVPFATLPNICDIDQRWFWVEKRVLPLWKRVDQSDRALKDNLSTLARRREWQAPIESP